MAGMPSILGFASCENHLGSLRSAEHHGPPRQHRRLQWKTFESGSQCYGCLRRSTIAAMRKSFWIVLALLVVCGAPVAHADSFTDGTLHFTVTSGSPAPTGSFVFDNTTNMYTSFKVDWDGAVFDFGSEFNGSNAVLENSGSWCATAPANFSGGSNCEPSTASLYCLRQSQQR